LCGNGDTQRPVLALHLQGKIGALYHGMHGLSCAPQKLAADFPFPMRRPVTQRAR
jgi:hypothetical protein